MSNREIIDGYTKAWIAADYDKVRSLLADDLDFQGSMEKHTSADAFMGGLKMFRDQMFESFHPLVRVDGQDTAFKLYDCGLKNGVMMRCAEYFKVEDGKIKTIRLVFDTAVLAPPQG